MKKLLATFLTLALAVSSLCILPASADTITKEIKVTGITAESSPAYLTYTVDNVLDGKTDTYFMAGKASATYSTSGNYLWLDLGQAYDIGKIVITMPNVETKKTLFDNDGKQNQNAWFSLCNFSKNDFKTQNGVDFAPGTHMTANGFEADFIKNGMSSLNASKIKNASNAITSCADWSGVTSKLVQENESGNMVFTWTAELAEGASTNYRYLVLAGPYTAGLCISEIEVYANVEEEVQTEEQVVSNNKAIFSSGSRVSDGFDENYAIDGDEDTAFAAAAYPKWISTKTGAVYSNLIPNYDFVIDLGKKFLISKIEFTPYNPTKGSANITYTIGGTNDYATTAGMPEPTVTTLATYAGAADKTMYTANNLSGEYRFIVVNVENGVMDEETSAAIIAGIREIKVYAKVEAADTDWDANTKMSRVSRGKAVLHSGTIRDGYGTADKATDGDYYEGYTSVMAVSGTKNCFVVDLGEAYSIAAVDLMQIYGNSGFSASTGVDIIATNDTVTAANAATANYTTLASGVYFANNTIKKLLYVPIAADKQATKYRYVGIRGMSGSYMPIRELDVFTGDGVEKAVVSPLTYKSNAADKTVSYELTTNGAELTGCVLIAASYQNSRLLGVKVSGEVTPGTDGKLQGTLTDAVKDGADEVRMFVWNSMTGLKPVTIAIGG